MKYQKLFVEICSIVEKKYPKSEAKSIAYLLFEYFTELKRHEIQLDRTSNVSQLIAKQLREAANTMVEKCTPIQYITGNTEFYDLHFNLAPGILIPRPETEELVDIIIKEIKTKQPEQPLNILDIGCGSGCIPVSIAASLPRNNVYAIDISPTAIDYSRWNAKINHVNIDVHLVDIFKWRNHPFFSGTKFDIIISNPPYVAEKERDTFDDNVLKHEPHEAIFVPDSNPLLFYFEIASMAKEKLNIGGELYFEVNSLYGIDVTNELKKLGYKSVTLVKDMFERDRFVSAINTKPL